MPCYNHNCVQGLIACTLAVCLVTASAAPLFLEPGIIAGLGAGGLTFSLAGVPALGVAPIALATLPLANIVAGKAVLVGAGVAKGVILSELLNRSRAEREQTPQRRN